MHLPQQALSGINSSLLCILIITCMQKQRKYDETLEQGTMCYLSLKCKFMNINNIFLSMFM